MKIFIIGSHHLARQRERKVVQPEFTNVHPEPADSTFWYAGIDFIYYLLNNNLTQLLFDEKTNPPHMLLLDEPYEYYSAVAYTAAGSRGRYLATFFVFLFNMAGRCTVTEYIRQIELSSTIMVCFVPVIAGPRYMEWGKDLTRNNSLSDFIP
ncbi:hypothetical protein WN51_01421 [Melipona quadrifasciata]|uniref:Uncharacterized protein n=1 Tax=Melipona quadrifasciata TaxID=166423 RepID=A0A0M8ZYQ2_9HYME|nr:hypothetical protein WN51_01421 [Melipona quadrifasciata]